MRTCEESNTYYFAATTLQLSASPANTQARPTSAPFITFRRSAILLALSTLECYLGLLAASHTPSNVIDSPTTLPKQPQRINAWMSAVREYLVRSSFPSKQLPCLRASLIARKNKQQSFQAADQPVGRPGLASRMELLLRHPTSRFWR